MNFLPDTNIIINFLKGKDPDKTFLSNLLINNHLLISTISSAEFIAGASESDKDKFYDFCKLGDLLDVNQEIAVAAGEYRQKLQRKTKKVYLLDCFLAATCKKHNLVLITNNAADYPMRDIKIIKPG